MNAVKDENLESQKEDSSSLKGSSATLKPEVDSKLEEIMEDFQPRKES
jgi:hypothetical protein